MARKFDMTYGLLGFERKWRWLQGHPIANLTQLISDEAIKKGVDVLAVTSASEDKPQGIHNRYGFLLNSARDLPQKYSHDKLGNNSFVIERDRKQVVIVNSQQVLTNLNGKRTDFWIIGKNDQDYNANPRKTLKETLEECTDVLRFTKPSGLYGLSEEQMKEYIPFFDAAIISAEAGQERNEETLKKLSELRNNQIPLNPVYVSASHKICGIGRSYTEAEIDTSTEQKLLDSLKKEVRKGNLNFHLEYPGNLYQLSWQVPLGAYCAYLKVKEKIGLKE